MKIYDINDKASYTLGMSISIELLQNYPWCVKKVYYSSKMVMNENFDKLKKLCDINNIQLINDDKTIDILSIKENCYVIAVFDKFYNELASNNHLVLMDFKDEGSLGTILRTAISFNHRDIILINCDVDYFKPKVVRASMGSIFYTNIKKYDSLELYLKDFPGNNIYNISYHGKTELSDIRLKEPYSLIYTNNYMDKITIGEGIYIKHQVFDNIPLAMTFATSLHNFYAKK